MGPLNIDMSEFKETSRKLDLLQTWTNSLAYLKNIDEKYILTLYRPAIAKASLIGLSKECKDILLTLKMLALEDQQVQSDERFKKLEKQVEVLESEKQEMKTEINELKNKVSTLEITISRDSK